MAARAEPHSARGREVVFSHTPWRLCPRAPGNPSAASARGHVPAAQPKERLTFGAKEFPLVSPAQAEKPVSEAAEGESRTAVSTRSWRPVAAELHLRRLPVGSRWPLPAEALWASHFLCSALGEQISWPPPRAILITLCWPAACKRCALCHSWLQPTRQARTSQATATAGRPRHGTGPARPCSEGVPHKTQRVQMPAQTAPSRLAPCSLRRHTGTDTALPRSVEEIKSLFALKTERRWLSSCCALQSLFPHGKPNHNGLPTALLQKYKQFSILL